MSAMAYLAILLHICVLPLSFAYRRVETTWRTSGLALVLQHSNHSISGQANAITNSSDRGPNIPWSTTNKGPISKAKSPLGKGSYGGVTLHKIVLDACRDESVAVKTMKVEAGKEYRIARELNPLLELRDNVHINRLLDYWPRRFCDSVRNRMEPEEVKPDYVYFLLEIAHGGTLETIGRRWEASQERTRPRYRLGRKISGLIFSSSTKRREAEWREAKGKSLNQLLKMLLHDLLDGLRYMHLNKIMHRDIKPDNIFGIDQSLSDCMKDLSCRFVLGDLGLAGSVDSVVAKTQKKNTVPGTPAWFPPELHHKNATGWTAAGDVWALGACVSAFLTKNMTGTHIAHGIHYIKAEIQANTYIDDNLKALLVLMTDSRTSNRPTAEGAFQTVQASLGLEERSGRVRSQAFAEENKVFQNSCLGDCLSQDDGCTKVS